MLDTVSPTTQSRHGYVNDVQIMWNTHRMATQTTTADAHKNETLHKTPEVLRVRLRGRDVIAATRLNLSRM